MVSGTLSIAGNLDLNGQKFKFSEDIMIKKDYKADYEKTDKGTYLIKMSDFYSDYKDEQEYIEVSEEVIDFLGECKRKDERYRDWIRRHRSGLRYDDEEFISKKGLYCESISNEKEAEIFLEQALSKCSEKIIRRAKMYFLYGLSISDISKMETVCYTSVKGSIEKAENILCEITKEND